MTAEDFSQANWESRTDAEQDNLVREVGNFLSLAAERAGAPRVVALLDGHTGDGVIVTVPE